MQKYFVKSKDRNGSCYYEFYKGEWDKKTFWSVDSVCKHDDDWYDCNFVDIIIKFVPHFDPFGETEINREQWEQIKKDALLSGGKSAEIVIEVDEWVVDTFSKYKVFTVLGL